jgi:two-component system, sensor histidine kinase PdtaS
MTETGRKTILLVEDEAIIAKAESMMLERHGYAVRAAYSGEAAIEEAASPAVDLVLMDIDLGRGIDGTEAAERILEARNLPVLFLSSHTEHDVVERTQGITSFGYVVKNSGETVLLASIAMAFRLFEARQQNQKKAEELEAANARLRESLIRNEVVSGELKEREAALRGLFDAIPAGVGMLRNRIIHKINAEYCAIFGYSEEELLGRGTRMLYFDDADHERVGKELYGALSGNRRSLLEARLRRKDGSPVEVLIGASAVDPASPDPMSSAVTVLFDVTERKRAQDSLRMKDRLLAELFRACPESIALATFDEGRFVDVNEATSRQILYSREELVGRTANELGLWCSMEDQAAAVARLRRGEMVRNLETRMRRKDGVEFDVLTSMSVVEMAGCRYIISFVLDMGDRKRMETALAASLREKETLLHELQHRIKNSLAMIASLVSLEAGRAAVGETREILGNLKDRVLSLSSLYEILLKSGAADAIDLGEYLRSIVSTLSETYAGEGRDLRIEEDIEGMMVDVKRAVPLGLIVNELTTNALKYAFAPGSAGAIRVALSRSEGSVELSVSDDGVGLPGDFDLESSGGLGLSIVRMMAAQLGWELSVSRAGGTAFVLRSPRPA